MLNPPSGNDVIAGLRNLALNPERAEWQLSPQHYLITQDTDDDNKEALLLCLQKAALAKASARVKLPSPAETIQRRKQRYPNPYELPGHLVMMEVSLDGQGGHEDEPIYHQLEIRTADKLKTHKNNRGFQVSKLEDTTVLGGCPISLPQHYYRLFPQQNKVVMYVSMSVKGQDIVFNVVRPRDGIDIPYDISWMTLPELLGTCGEDSVEIFETSVLVTAAVPQSNV